MTVVLEDQMKSIAANIVEKYDIYLSDDLDHIYMVETMVRAIIAQYDISSIARLELPEPQPLSRIEQRINPANRPAG